MSVGKERDDIAFLLSEVNVFVQQLHTAANDKRPHPNEWVRQNLTVNSSGAILTRHVVNGVNIAMGNATIPPQIWTRHSFF